MKIHILLFAFAILILFFHPVKSQTFTSYDTTAGLLHQNVICLTIDTAGNLWFGTQDGVSIFDGSNWSSHTQATDSGLVHNTIDAIRITSTGDVWVGTAFGASAFDGSTWTSYTATDGLGHNQVKCIAEGGNGDIWFGTLAGISRFDGANWQSWGQAQGFPFGGVNSITPDASGKLWLGTALGGVIIFDDSIETTITVSDGLVSNQIRAIAIDGSGRKWVGTASGVTVLNAAGQYYTNHTIMYVLPPPDTLNPVVDVKIDTAGRPWVGVYVDYLVTVGGIGMYESGQWTDFDDGDGIIGPVIRQLAVDGQNDIWIATSTGVTEISNIPIARENAIEKNQFDVWPNPAEGILHVAQVNERFSQIQEIGIYNSTMQCVLRIPIQTGSTGQAIDVSQLSPGVYFLKAGETITRILLK